MPARGVARPIAGWRPRPDIGDAATPRRGPRHGVPIHRAVPSRSPFEHTDLCPRGAAPGIRTRNLRALNAVPLPVGPGRRVGGGTRTRSTTLARSRAAGDTSPTGPVPRGPGRASVPVGEGRTDASGPGTRRGSPLPPPSAGPVPGPAVPYERRSRAAFGFVRYGGLHRGPSSFRAEPQRGVEPRPAGRRPAALPLRLLRRGRLASEWQDSNLRPSAPKADGLAKLPHTRSGRAAPAARETPPWTDRESNPELLLARQV